MCGLANARLQALSSTGRTSLPLLAASRTADRGTGRFAPAHARHLRASLRISHALYQTRHKNIGASAAWPNSGARPRQGPGGGRAPSKSGWKILFGTMVRAGAIYSGPEGMDLEAWAERATSTDAPHPNIPREPLKTRWDLQVCPCCVVCVVWAVAPKGWPKTGTEDTQALKVMTTQTD